MGAKAQCEREKLIKKAEKMPLGELAKKVVFGEYTSGVHDEVLLERCERISRAPEHK